MAQEGQSVVGEKRTECHDASTRGLAQAMNALLNLQAKGSMLARVASTRKSTLEIMDNYMKRLHLDISSLSVIHVAGTKGKGSTCAMVERILREKGFKTALFTSPHLVSVCERFRINGDPVHEQIFLKHFWRVWDRLHDTMVSN